MKQKKTSFPAMLKVILFLIGTPVAFIVILAFIFFTVITVGNLRAKKNMDNNFVKRFDGTVWKKQTNDMDVHEILGNGKNILLDTPVGGTVRIGNPTYSIGVGDGGSWFSLDVHQCNSQQETSTLRGFYKDVIKFQDYFVEVTSPQEKAACL